MNHPTLPFPQKINALRTYLNNIGDTYADSFKTDILFVFNELDDVSETDSTFHFLKLLNSMSDIHQYMDNMISSIILKYKEEEEQLSDFIHYYTNP